MSTSDQIKLSISVQASQLGAILLSVFFRSHHATDSSDENLKVKLSGAAVESKEERKREHLSEPARSYP